MKTKIICVVGGSGTGKTALSLHLKSKGWYVVTSRTTRPMREGEAQGVEHLFVEEFKGKASKLLAYTKFGGHHYWAEESDVEGKGVAVYVIDEKGLLNLLETHSDKYDILSVLVKRAAPIADEARLARDKCRVVIDESSYDAVVDNNGTLEEFLKKGEAAIRNLLAKSGDPVMCYSGTEDRWIFGKWVGGDFALTRHGYYSETPKIFRLAKYIVPYQLFDPCSPSPKYSVC